MLTDTDFCCFSRALLFCCCCLSLLSCCSEVSLLDSKPLLSEELVSFLSSLLSFFRFRSLPFFPRSPFEHFFLCTIHVLVSLVGGHRFPLAEGCCSISRTRVSVPLLKPHVFPFFMHGLHELQSLASQCTILTHSMVWLLASNPSGQLSRHFPRCK